MYTLLYVLKIAYTNLHHIFFYTEINNRNRVTHSRVKVVNIGHQYSRSGLLRSGAVFSERITDMAFCFSPKKYPPHAAQGISQHTRRRAGRTKSRSGNEFYSAFKRENVIWVAMT